MRTLCSAVAALCGCYPQTHAEDVRKLDVDLIAGTGDRSGFPALLEELITEQADNIMKKYPSISSLEEAFRAALEFSMENKRAVLHIYNSVSRDNFEQYALRICGYVVNTYAASTLKDKGISEEDTKALCRFIKCSLFGLYIDWLGGNMKEDILSDLARLARLARLAAEELARASGNTAD